METSEIILTLMEASSQLRVFHWQTKSFAEHKALGDIYETFEEATDDFAETLIGIDGKRPALRDRIEIQDYAAGAPARYIKGLADLLSGITGTSDIENMRDALLEKCHKTLYLLTLDSEEEEEAEATEQPETEIGEPPVEQEAEATEPPAEDISSPPVAVPEEPQEIPPPM